MSETTTPEIDVEEFAATRDSGTFVDVRELAEYVAGFEVLSVAGGTGAWLRSGRPVEGGMARARPT